MIRPPREQHNTDAYADEDGNVIYLNRTEQTEHDRAEDIDSLIDEYEREHAAPGPPDSDTSGQAEPDPEPHSWTPIDLGPYLRGEIQPATPTIGLPRTDGLQLLYPGLEHCVMGEMESGKTWFASACVAIELQQGNHVLYVHFEEGSPAGLIERLRALGVPVHVIAAQLRFVGPEQPVRPQWLDELLDPAPTIAVLDGVNEALDLHDQDADKTSAAARYRRLLVKPCTRAGAAVLSCDHVVKDRERRGRTPMGTVGKGNGISGSLLLLENTEPFGRGARGRSKIFVTKDRPGHLRKHGQPDSKAPGRTYMGDLVIDDTRTRYTCLDVRFWEPHPPTDDQANDTGDQLADTIAALLAKLPDQSVPSLRELNAQVRKADIKARDTAVRDAIDDLVAHGRATKFPGPHRATGYRLTASASQETS